MKKKPSLLIFDVNETLIDLDQLKKATNKALGSSKAFDFWFAQLLEFSSVETLIGSYRDFGEIGAAVFRMTAQKLSVEIQDKEIKEITGMIKELPPHPEVPDALKKLKNNGFRLVALTNGGKKTVDKQLEFAGIKDVFDSVYSVDAVQKFKPHPDPYNFVLEEEAVAPGDAMLIAAHAWDVLGGQQAGLQTAFISRPGKFLYPHGRQPEVKGKDVEDVANSLLKG